MQLLPTLLLAAACSTSALPPSPHSYTAKSRADSAGSPPPPPLPPPPPQSVQVDWDRPAGIGISRTTTTLQVVTNPILDRVFPNGVANPIHGAAWESLKNLTADYVRFVPWYPYPRKSVAELFPPVPGKPTSWNFTLLIPQLEDFFRSTADQGKDTVVNFATQPCWMFNKNLSWCTPPTNPDEAYFNYAGGGVQSYDELDSTGKTLAEYYARLIGYLMTGEMVDEHGVKHAAPPGRKTEDLLTPVHLCLCLCRSLCLRLSTISPDAISLLLLSLYTFLIL